MFFFSRICTTGNIFFLQFNYYMDTLNPFLERVEEVGRETSQRLDCSAFEAGLGDFPALNESV